ncbi:MAG: formiminoglutamase, partial [Proteobacteria bacterium]
YHLDLHTMPSQGEAAHPDSGRLRSQVVLSDCMGKSASRGYFNLVRNALLAEGFELAINDPYKGGRITQRYGRPEAGIETLQIELNRALYLDEKTRERTTEFESLQGKLARSIAVITQAIDQDQLSEV